MSKKLFLLDGMAFVYRAHFTFAILALMLTAPFSVPAGTSTWEELTSHLFTNAAIVWHAPTNNLPKSLWTYNRQLPHVFTATVISNAMVLGSLQKKGFPRPSTNDFFISEDKGPHYPGPVACIFGIRPGDANIFYWLPNSNMGSGREIPGDETILKGAWQCASQLGIDRTKLVQQSFYTRLCNGDPNGKKATNTICGRGVFLSRHLDGIAFFSANNDGEGAEGFSIEYCGPGIIRSFSLRWSNLERNENQATASPQHIIDCIKAHKTIVVPNVDEADYFGRLRKLAQAKKLSIIKMTPYYGEGIFGEIPTNDVPCKFAIPFAALEADADFGNSNMTFRLLSPILSSEVIRLMKGKTP